MRVYHIQVRVSVEWRKVFRVSDGYDLVCLGLVKYYNIGFTSGIGFKRKDQLLFTLNQTIKFQLSRWGFTKNLFV